MVAPRVAWMCFLLALGVCCVSASLWQEATSPVPLVMWSGLPIFSTPQVLDTVSTSDVQFVLASLLKTQTNKDSKLATSLNDNTDAPEVVVLFVEPELNTEQIPHIVNHGSFSHLQNAIADADSSLTLPYTTIEEVTLFDDTLLDAFETMKGSVFISRLSGSNLFTRLTTQRGVKNVELSSLIDELKSENAFSNGVTDLVVVCFETAGYHKGVTFGSHDQIIGDVSESIRTATKGNYVAVYSANRPAQSRITWKFEAPVEEQQHYHNLRYVFAGNNNSNSSNSTSHKVNYFPGPLLEAFLIVGVLLAMLFTGGCAIFGLQTPDRWEAPKVKRDL